MFWGALSEFLDSIYKIDTDFDHVTKFNGDRPRELGDYSLKKRKHHEQNRRSPALPVKKTLKIAFYIEK